MAGLSFSGPQLGQKIRMKLAASNPEEVILLTESNSDTSSLAAVLSNDVELLKAQGKANCIGVHHYLTLKERGRVLIIVDCDGENNQSILALDGLVISENRDLEADIFFGIRGFEEIVLQILAESDGKVGEFRNRANAVGRYITELACVVGATRDIANDLGLNTRVVDERTKRKRRIGVRDFPGIAELLESTRVPSLEEVAIEFSKLQNWPINSIERIISADAKNSLKDCRIHVNSDCLDCRVRRFVNGHELVELGTKFLIQIDGGLIDSYGSAYKHFERILKSKISAGGISEWATLKRIRKFEHWSDRQILNNNYSSLLN